MTIRQKSSHRGGIRPAQLVLAAVVAQVVACVTVRTAVAEADCPGAWVCPAEDVRCLHPCMAGLREPVNGVLDAALLDRCRVQLAFERSRRVGEMLLTSYAWYRTADPEADRALDVLIDALARLGHHDLALPLRALRLGRAGDPDGGLAAVEQARVAGTPRCALAQVANDLSGVFYQRGRLGKAARLNLLAQDLVGSGTTVHAYLLTASLRILAGTNSVDKALERSDELLDGLSDLLLRGWVHLQRVDLLYIDGSPRTAANEAWVTISSALADRAVVLRAANARGQVLSAAFYALASLLRERRQFDAAEDALDTARELTPDDAAADQLYARALINRDRGRLELAEAGLTAALEGSADGVPAQGGLAWAVPFELGRVRLMRGDRAGAEQALRTALERVEVLREGAPDREAQMIALYRQPYEALLGLLADDGRWHEAFEVLARLDARRFNSELATPSDFLMDRFLQLGGGGLTSWDAGAMAPPTAEALLEAWRGRHLVAVFRAGTRLCRIDVVDGNLTGVCPGPASELEAAAGVLREQPADAVAGRALGAALVPPGDDQLDVLLVGPIARAPLAALRDQHEPIVAHRPLRRVLGLLDGGRGVPTDGRPRVVGFAGHAGNATSAVAEAEAIGTMLGVEAKVGPAAGTTEVLAAGAGLLHIAGHARSDDDGVPQLELADAEVSAPRIAALTSAPRLVVLANCSSAAATDDGSWGSLGAAFLHAGSDQVIASDRPVDDRESRALMLQFYERGGVRDPARVLGEVAAGLGRAAPSSTTWAAFTVIAAPPRPPR